MSPERWRQITELFHAALAHDAATRNTLLDEACRGDDALRAEVGAMLAAHGQAGGFGEAPLVTAAEPGGRLQPGTALGPYRIEALIGAGGMGEVYRARDTRLERDVAVKVLPQDVAADPRQKQRLDREAKALATLSHPHICPVFDVGHQDGVDYLVMEYLQGETLEERLAKGALPVDQALRRAVEIADALDKAHARGVVHRDLKPGNIMLTKTGAWLLDFGLAKQRLSSPLAGATAPTALTDQGKVIGTLQYMSPEQLHGQEADARSDIFAFGTVLYEMVTGRKAFDGKSRASIVAAILEHDPPPVSTLQPTSPPALDHLIRTCLAKDPDQRWQSAGDIGRHLAWLLGQGSQPEAALPELRRGHAPWRRALPLVLASGLAVSAAVIGLRWAPGATGSSPLLQSVLPPPPGALLRVHAGFALSPDGSRLAFVASDSDGVSKLWVRELAARAARALPGTEGARPFAASPFWSPDGRDIGFFTDQKLKRVPAAGGPVQVLAGPNNEPKGGTWSPDGRIVYVPDYRTGLFEVPASGGQSRPLTTLDSAGGEVSHRWPRFLPDGKALLFLAQTAEAGADDDRSRIEALDTNGRRHEVLRVNASAQYAASGWLVFWRDGSISAQRFDPTRLRLHGESHLLAEDVDLTISEWATFSVSDQGTLVYASALPWRLRWHERSGRPLPTAPLEGGFAEAALSPDGRRVAYVADHTTVRILDLARGTDSRLASEPFDHFAPAWGPLGEWVAYSANKASMEAGSEIRRRRSSGIGETEVLYSSATVVRRVSWSPADRWIAFEENADIHLLDLQSRTARRRVSGPALERAPAFSPDGRWLAYSSNESGRDEVYVVPAVDGPGRWQISTAGGFEPRWGATGREIYFLAPHYELRVAAVDLDKGPKFGIPEPLFVLPGAKPGTTYGIGPDGSVLVRAQPSDGGSESLRLVLNWPRLLEEPPR